jgi:hypothetical protein
VNSRKKRRLLSHPSVEKELTDVDGPEIPRWLIVLGLPACLFVMSCAAVYDAYERFDDWLLDK